MLARYTYDYFGQTAVFALVTVFHHIAKYMFCSLLWLSLVHTASAGWGEP